MIDDRADDATRDYLGLQFAEATSALVGLGHPDVWRIIRVEPGATGPRTYCSVEDDHNALPTEEAEPLVWAWGRIAYLAHVGHAPMAPYARQFYYSGVITLVERKDALMADLAARREKAQNDDHCGRIGKLPRPGRSGGMSQLIEEAWQSLREEQGKQPRSIKSGDVLARLRRSTHDYPVESHRDGRSPVLKTRIGGSDASLTESSLRRIVSELNRGKRVPSDDSAR